MMKMTMMESIINRPLAPTKTKWLLWPKAWYTILKEEWSLLISTYTPAPQRRGSEADAGEGRQSSHLQVIRGSPAASNPALEPGQSEDRPCQAHSHPQFPFPSAQEPRGSTPSSPLQPTMLGLGALPGPLLGPESWQQLRLQDEETGNSPQVPECSVAARP